MKHVQSKKSLKVFLIIGLIFGVVILSGCQGSTGVDSKTGRKYFQGYESVEMKFLEDSPPPIFYYDSEAGLHGDSPMTGYTANTIPVIVELYNKGSSDSVGVLFVHGFDPHIVAVSGYTEGYPGYTGSSGWWNMNRFSGWQQGTMINIMSGPNGGGGSISVSNPGLMLSLGGFGFGDRAQLFGALGFGMGNTRAGSYYPGISAGVASARVGQVLSPLMTGMFKNYGWYEGWIKNFELEGRNSYSPAGGMDVVEFPATIMNLAPSLEEFRQRVMVTSCFGYATHASDMVCIDPEPYSNVKKACKPQTISMSGGQGAPVSVVTVEQRPGRGKTTFVINVKHNKKGTYDELYSLSSLYKCDPASAQVVKATDKNIVNIAYVYLSDMDITMNCIPDQVIRLDSTGSGQITCSVEFPPGMSTSAYLAPLEVELWYGYSKTIYKDIIVRRI